MIETVESWVGQIIDAGYVVPASDKTEELNRKTTAIAVLGIAIDNAKAGVVPKSVCYEFLYGIQTDDVLPVFRGGGETHLAEMGRMIKKAVTLVYSDVWPDSVSDGWAEWMPKPGPPRNPPSWPNDPGIPRIFWPT